MGLSVALFIFKASCLDMSLIFNPPNGKKPSFLWPWARWNLGAASNAYLIMVKASAGSAYERGISAAGRFCRQPAETRAKAV
jgi:hypothetical protein